MQYELRNPTPGIYAHVIGNEHREAAEKVAGELLPDATKATKENSQVAWVQ